MEPNNEQSDISPKEEIAPENKSKKRAGRLIWIFWISFLSILVGTILFFTGISLEWFGPMPSFAELENPRSNLASEVYSADGVLLGKYYIENRSNVHYQDLSPHLVHALLATEDIRFYEHAGVDPRATFRVAYGVLTGNHKGGGSTITQQLAKNLFPRGERLSTSQLVMRKFKEWVTAIKLERNYSKNEILAMYLNTIDFGSHSFGIKSAASTFFNKSPDSLNIQEAALFVAILNAPTRYSPVRNPENALNRRNLVIRQMEKYNFIEDGAADSLEQLPIDMSHYGIRDHNTGIARYFREHLRQELHAWCKTHYKPDGTPYNLYRDGLRIYTTIDSRMQEYAEWAVREHLSKDLQPTFFKHWKGYSKAPFDKELSWEQINSILDNAMRRSERYRVLRNAGYDKKEIKEIFNTETKMKVFSWNGPIDTVMSPMDSIKYYQFFLRAGLMSMEPHSGYVRAYVGGPDYTYFKYDQVKSGRRQVGSTFKPFVYTLAMQEGGMTPCTEVPNIQVSVELPDGTFWKPKSSAKRAGEMVTLKWALANSINWVSAYLIKRYSPQAVIKIARKMGVTSPIPEVPAISLGSPDISLFEMVGAFNTFGNKGVFVEPVFMTKITDKNGNIIDRFTPKREEAIDEITAYKMLRLMEGVVESGTGIRLRFKYNLYNQIAGKTGTTNNHSDGWFMGITPKLTTGVWVGGEVRSIHFRYISLGQGANMALPIWALYMQKLYADPEIKLSQEDFLPPARQMDINFDCNESDDEGFFEEEEEYEEEF